MVYMELIRKQLERLFAELNAPFVGANRGSGRASCYESGCQRRTQEPSTA